MWAEIPILGRLGAVLSVLAILGGVYAVWHHNVYTQGYGACTAKQQLAVIEGDKRYEKTYTEVQRLSDAALRHELCKWVRDTDLSTCLKTLAPFRK